MIKNSKIKKFNLNNNPKFARVSYYKYVENCNKNFTKLIFMKKAIVFLGVFFLGQNAFAQEEKRESKLKVILKFSIPMILINERIILNSRFFILLIAIMK